MNTIAHPLAAPSLASRVIGALRTETGLARAALGAVALHTVDDAFLQPNPGTSAADHLAGGLIPTAMLLATAWFYPRLRAGFRAALAFVFAFFAFLSSVEGFYYAGSVGPSGDDYTSLLAAPAGFVLIGAGAVALWKSRRTGDPLWWRYPRRLLITFGALVAASVVVVPLTVSYVVTHVARAEVPTADLGAPYEDVSFTTDDGLRLKGWYIESKNGAAVISFPGRASSQKRAKMLADHGYGVLLFDRRGEGESEGDPNLFGWQGERDVHAAVKFLQGRPDVDPQRIGGIGLSVGGEMMIEAAAESDALAAIVSEGGSGRSVRDDRRERRRRVAEPGRRRRRHGRDGALHEQYAAGRPEEPRPEDREPPDVLRLRREGPADREAGERGLLRGSQGAEGNLGGPRLQAHGRDRCSARRLRAPDRRVLRPVAPQAESIARVRASRPPASTGSPCETRTSSIGRSSSGRSSSRSCARVMPLGR